KLDGCSLHACRAGNGHWASRQINLLNSRVLDDLPAALHMFAEHLVRIVIDEIDLRASLDALPGRADHKRCFAAFGNGQDDVLSRNPKVPDLFAPESGKILEPFDGFDQGKIATGHHAPGAVFELFAQGSGLQTARPLLLPEMAPD